MAGKRNRTFRGKLVRPRKQLLVGMILVAVGVLFLAVPLTVVTLKITQFVADIEATNPIVAVYLREFTAPALKMITGYTVVFGVFALFLGVALSHRVYGPLVPILRHVESLRNRDYSSRIHLRSGDELGDLAQALNQLAESLEGADKRS